MLNEYEFSENNGKKNIKCKIGFAPSALLSFSSGGFYRITTFLISTPALLVTFSK